MDHAVTHQPKWTIIPKIILLLMIAAYPRNSKAELQLGTVVYDHEVENKNFFEIAPRTPITPELVKAMVDKVPVGFGKEKKMICVYSYQNTAIPIEITLYRLHKDGGATVVFRDMTGSSMAKATLTQIKGASYASIDQISRKSDVADAVSGTKLLNIASSFLKSCGVVNVALKDRSGYYCDQGANVRTHPALRPSYSLSSCRILTHGSSWYSSLGFFPESDPTGSVEKLLGTRMRETKVSAILGLVSDFKTTWTSDFRKNRGDANHLLDKIKGLKTMESMLAGSDNSNESLQDFFKRFSKDHCVDFSKICKSFYESLSTEWLEKVVVLSDLRILSFANQSGAAPAGATCPP